MSANPISALRDAHLAAIANLGRFKTVEKHHGKFTVEDLKRMGGSAPALKVGFQGRASGGMRSDRRLRLGADFVAVIVCRAGNRDQGDDEALDLSVDVAGSVAALSPGAAGISDCGLAEAVEIDAIDADDAALGRLVIVAVTWRHGFTAGTSIYAAAPDTPVVGPRVTTTINDQPYDKEAEA